MQYIHFLTTKKSTDNDFENNINTFIIDFRDKERRWDIMTSALAVLKAKGNLVSM